MNVWILFVFLVYNENAFVQAGDAICRGLKLEDLKPIVTETTLNVSWEASDSASGICDFKDAKVTLNPDIYTESCDIPNRICTFKKLKKFTNYTFTILPISPENEKLSPVIFKFFTIGDCFPQNIVDLKFDDDRAVWKIDSIFESLLDNYEISVIINQSTPCGARTLPYAEHIVTHNESLTIKTDIPGIWTVCVEPYKKNQPWNCPNRECLSKNFSTTENFLKVDDFSLTSGERSLIIEWSPNIYWPHYCHVKYYEISTATLSFEKSCEEMKCQMIIENLIPDKNYTVQITPVFTKNIIGRTAFRSETPYSCPAAVTDVVLERNDSKFHLSWTDNSKNKSDFFTVAFLTKSSCFYCNYSSVISVNVSEPSFVYEDRFPNLDVKFTISPFKSHDYNCPASTTEKEMKSMRNKPDVSDVFSIDYQDLETFVAYDNVTFQKGNCSIVAIELLSNRSLSFNCSNKGRIQNSELEPGKTYELQLNACNSRGCTSSKPFTAPTPPKPYAIEDFEITLAASNANAMSLQFPNKKESKQGSIYIIVAEIQDQPHDINELVDFVKKSNLTTLGGRTALMLPTRKHVILESVPLGTLKYDIKKEFLIKEGIEIGKGFYVTPVIEYWSGAYSMIVAYKFQGPFAFKEIGKTSVILWIAGTFGSMAGIIYAILVVQRKHRSPIAKLVHNGIKTLSFSSPTHESSQNNPDLESECEKRCLNKENQKLDKAMQLSELTKIHLDSDSDETAM